MQSTCLQRGRCSSRLRSSSVHSSRRPRRSNQLNCHASVIWRQLDRSQAWVAHPRAARVKGVIHFLGGAFAGAAPQLLYNAFIESLADAGYTTIATPYQVTFRHDQCAKSVRQAFLDSLSELKAGGRSYLVPSKAPVYGVGHSNGALLQLLIGSLEPEATQGNVIISYNNLQVADAIPIPGFLEALQPTVQAVRSLSSSDDASNSSSSSTGRRSAVLLPVPNSEQVLAAAAATVPAFLLPAEQQLIAGAAPALDQLASVVNEVGDGLTDFRPTPEESRAIIAAGYSCPNTLLIKFENDTNFDETPEMEQILTQRFSNLASVCNNTGGSSSSNSSVEVEAAAAAAAELTATAVDYTAWSSIDEDVDINRVLLQLEQLQQQQWQQQQQLGLQAVVLPGTHITPCGGQVRRDGGLLPPIAQTNGQAELKTLSKTVLEWLNTTRNSTRRGTAGNATTPSRSAVAVVAVQDSSSAAAVTA